MDGTMIVTIAVIGFFLFSAGVSTLIDRDTSKAREPIKYKNETRYIEPGSVENRESDYFYPNPNDIGTTTIGGKKTKRPNPTKRTKRI